MVKSKLPNQVLGKIWKLADVDKDGQLDGDEFALANYLINLKLEGTHFMLFHFYTIFISTKSLFKKIIS